MVNFNLSETEKATQKRQVAYIVWSQRFNLRNNSLTVNIAFFPLITFLLTVSIFISLFLVVAVLYLSEMITVLVFNVKASVVLECWKLVMFASKIVRNIFPTLDVHAVARSIPNSYHVHRNRKVFSETVQLLGVCSYVIVM